MLSVSPHCFLFSMKRTTLISESELRVLTLIAQNKPTRKIAEELGLKPKTVENHRYNIARKLNLSGNNCVLKYALEHKLELQKI